MKKVIFDTNVLIDWINERQFAELIFESGTAKYLSSIVLMELLAGASRTEDQKIIKKLHNTHKKAGRMLTSSETNYAEAGDILLELQKTKGYDLKKSFTLTNDVLIALTARSVGATLFTQNRKDFQAIRGIKVFDLVVC
jgi:predicted nucleic acid-binding protein